MDLSTRLQDLMLFLIFAKCTQSMRVKDDFYNRSREMCMRVAKQPFFDIDLVLGEPWKIYYTWNLKLDVACFEMKFKNATKEVIKRVRSDMGKYLDQQPSWEAATLTLYMGPSEHEMLLFADQGPAGSFVAVTNMARSSVLIPRGKEVSLLKFQLKLLGEGQYLLFVDCNVGVASLGARPKDAPLKPEIDVLVAGFKLGDGFPACKKHNKKYEQFRIF